MSCKLYATSPVSGLIYTFPSAETAVTGWGGGMEAIDESLDMRSEVEERRWSPGGMMVGDNLLASRKIVIEGIWQGPSRAEMMNGINEMKNACYRGNHNFQQLWLQVSQYSSAPYNSVYKVAGCQRFEVEWISYTSVEITVEFALADPFRYERWNSFIPAQTAPIVSAVTSPYSWTVNVGDTAYIQVPEIIVTVLSGSLSAIRVSNISVRRPNYTTYPGLKVSGLDITPSGTHNTIVIDSTAGKVWLVKPTFDFYAGWAIEDSQYGNIDITNKVEWGDFPWMTSGSNTLYFVSSPVTPGAAVRLQYRLRLRRRWL